MIIETLVVGPIKTNCYIATDEKSRDSFIVDAGDNPAKIIGLVEGRLLSVKGIIATHGHFDHVTAVKALKDRFKAPFFMNPEDFPMLYDMGSPEVPLYDGLKLKAGGLEFKVIHTPGHTPGCVCLYSEKDGVLFSGDTLFYADHGRCDLPEGSYPDMKNSLIKLFDLPDDTVVYPGHGRKTKIGDEKKRGLV